MTRELQRFQESDELLLQNKHLKAEQDESTYYDRVIQSSNVSKNHSGQSHINVFGKSENSRMC